MKIKEHQLGDVVQHALDAHGMWGAIGTPTRGWWERLLDQPQVRATWDDGSSLTAFYEGAELAAYSVEHDIKHIYAARVKHKGERGTIFFACRTIRDVRKLVKQAVNGDSNG